MTEEQSTDSDSYPNIRSLQAFLTEFVHCKKSGSDSPSKRMTSLIGSVEEDCETGTETVSVLEEFGIPDLLLAAMDCPNLVVMDQIHLALTFTLLCQLSSKRIPLLLQVMGHRKASATTRLNCALTCVCLEQFPMYTNPSGAPNQREVWIEYRFVPALSAFRSLLRISEDHRLMPDNPAAEDYSSEYLLRASAAVSYVSLIQSHEEWKEHALLIEEVLLGVLEIYRRFYACWVGVQTPRSEFSADSPDAQSVNNLRQLAHSQLALPLIKKNLRSVLITGVDTFLNMRERLMQIAEELAVGIHQLRLPLYSLALDHCRDVEQSRARRVTLCVVYMESLLEHSDFFDGWILVPKEISHFWRHVHEIAGQHHPDSEHPENMSKHPLCSKFFREACIRAELENFDSLLGNEVCKASGLSVVLELAAHTLDHTSGPCQALELLVRWLTAGKCFSSLGLPRLAISAACTLLGGSHETLFLTPRLKTHFSQVLELLLLGLCSPDPKLVRVSRMSFFWLLTPVRQSWPSTLYHLNGSHATWRKKLFQGVQDHFFLFLESCSWTEAFFDNLLLSMAHCFHMDWTSDRITQVIQWCLPRASDSIVVSAATLGVLASQPEILPFINQVRVIMSTHLAIVTKFNDPAYHDTSVGVCSLIERWSPPTEQDTDQGEVEEWLTIGRTIFSLANEAFGPGVQHDPKRKDSLGSICVVVEKLAPFLQIRDLKMLLTICRRCYSCPWCICSTGRLLEKTIALVATKLTGGLDVLDAEAPALLEAVFEHDENLGMSYNWVPSGEEVYSEELMGLQLLLETCAAPLAGLPAPSVAEIASKCVFHVSPIWGDFATQDYRGYLCAAADKIDRAVPQIIALFNVCIDKIPNFDTSLLMQAGTIFEHFYVMGRRDVKELLLRCQCQRPQVAERRLVELATECAVNPIPTNPSWTTAVQIEVMATHIKACRLKLPTVAHEQWLPGIDPWIRYWLQAPINATDLTPDEVAMFNFFSLVQSMLEIMRLLVAWTEATGTDQFRIKNAQDGTATRYAVSWPALLGLLDRVHRELAHFTNYWDQQAQDMFDDLFAVLESQSDVLWSDAVVTMHLESRAALDAREQRKLLRAECRRVLVAYASEPRFMSETTRAELTREDQEEPPTKKQRH